MNDSPGPVRDWPIQVVSIFVVTRLMMFLLAYLSTLIIRHGPDQRVSSAVIDLFCKWDSGWYLSIVENGYTYSTTGPSSAAFFPVYPILVKILSAIVPSVKISGYIVSNCCLLVASFYIYLLTITDTGDSTTARRSVFYLCISPVGFFFSSIYTESTFILFTIATVYYARTGRWLVSGIFGAIASATRMLGILIIIPVAYEYYETYRVNRGRQRMIGSDFFYLAIIPLGLLGFMTFLYFRFSDPFAMVTAQAQWGRHVSSLLNAIDTMFNLPRFYVWIFFGSFVVIMLSILGMLRVHMRLSYVLYSLAYMVVTVFTGTFKSMPRIAGAIFPIYLFMSVFSSQKPIYDDMCTVFCLLFLSLFTILFANGYWFA
jgi:Gpi18-like mannosyltransferase